MLFVKGVNVRSLFTLIRRCLVFYNYILIFFFHFLGLYTIEFQKCGLPHAHILLWLDHRDKLKTPVSINSVICAEFPDERLFSKLYSVVKSFMIHGPCGFSRQGSPCMKGKRLFLERPLTRVDILYIAVGILELWL